MKSTIRTITIIAILLISIFLFNLLLNSLNYAPYWFTKLGSLATALAAFGGLCLLLVTFLYLLETRKMVQEMQRQREPAVTVKIIPDKVSFNFFNVWIKNTGGSPAYDISIKFTPDLPYAKTTLNNMNAMKHLPLLDTGEEIEFYFDSAVTYFTNPQNPVTSKIDITYYSSPKSLMKKSKEYKRNYSINLEERKGQRFLSKRNINDLVTEVEELKQGLLILLSELREEKIKNERKRKHIKSFRRYFRF